MTEGIKGHRVFGPESALSRYCNATVTEGEYDAGMPQATPIQNQRRQEKPGLGIRQFLSRLYRLNAHPRSIAGPVAVCRRIGRQLGKWLLRILTVTIAAPIGIAFGQTVAISPGSAQSCDLDGAIQFSATVTGSTNTKVSWYAGGVLGGNATAGVISTSGLYTAPKSVPSQNPVAITAVSQANSKSTATVEVTVENQVLLTVKNGSGGGSYAPGATVKIKANNPPLNDVFSKWTGAAVASATSASTTLVMPDAPATVTATYTLESAVPFPVASHPRLWITQADLPRLQSWAVSTNPVYAKGMAPLLKQAVNIYETEFFPKGVANTNYPDPGDTQGYSGELTEEIGFILAFNSLIDPSPANRIKYAQYARNLIMYAMNKAALGVLANAPFRDPMFPTYNRANATGPQWGLIVDWIYNAKDAGNNPILTAADKQTIRKVFMIWANECLNASTAGGDHPAPIGAMNSFSLIGNGAAAYRMACNNYYLGHARVLTTMALCIDPADDPVIDSTKSAATLGNTLRSYILDATGAWLYQVYAMMGDPQTVKADYGLPGNGSEFGLASGGLPPEGMLYGHSFGFLLGQLLALQTAGFNSVSLIGPQAKLITAPVWDRYVTGFMSSLTPTSHIPASETYLGPVYQFASYGDLLRLWVSPDFMQPFALLALLEQEQGQSTHLNAARWFASNVVQGTMAYNESEPWTWGCAQSVLYYMLFDPKAAKATDPRPNFPLNFVDQPASRILSRTNWNENATWFDYRASWESINHQLDDGGQFEFFRNGEWLTKEMSNYDNNWVGLTTYYHNSLALKNWCANGTPSLQWFENGEWTNGSQWNLSENAGDPVTVTSNGANYTYASSDLTKLYNRPDVYSPDNGATDITQATRSILWLNADFIVIYDRATSTHTGLFKTFNMCLATSPAISGNVAIETMGDGQKLFVQSLLPSNATLTARNAAGDLNPHSDLDPMNYVLTVEDKSLPTDTRFLHVLQGSDPSGKMVSAAYVASKSGTSFDGSVFGSAAVFFPEKANASFTTTTFTVPTAVTFFIVTGLKANAGYTVTVTKGSTTKTVTLAVGGTAVVADGAGLVKTGI